MCPIKRTKSKSRWAIARDLDAQIRYLSGEIDVLSEKKPQQTSDAFLAYVFSLIIEGLSALGYFPFGLRDVLS